MESRRQQKVANVLQKDLAEIFQQKAQFLFNGAFITVTVVRVSSDLSSAKVYLSIMGNKRDEQFKLVQKNQKEVRRLLGERVRHQLRVIPELFFYIDDSLDYYEKIDQLLKE